MNRSLRDYYTMCLIRQFEETVERLFARGEIRGTAHVAIGQEAVAVGACGALRRDDYVTSTHRGHGHFLARGAKPARIMAELFGRRTGYAGGRGGSQFMADFRLGFLGANGITGGSFALAVGLALACRMRQTDRVVLCFFGDGAANQGTFHESLNLAALWRLPVIFVCENNRYAMSTPVHQALSVQRIAHRASAYGIPGSVTDGNDLEAVREAVRTAVEPTRRGEGPALVECLTYRLAGHSRGDPRVYRSRSEEAYYRRLDPIGRYAADLKTRGLLTPETERSLLRQARATVQEAVRFARRSPFPSPTSLTQGVFP